MDKDSNVIGSRDGAFAITWQDYVAYSQGKAVVQRDFGPLVTNLKITSNISSPRNVPLPNQLEAGIDLHGIQSTSQSPRIVSPPQPKTPL